MSESRKENDIPVTSPDPLKRLQEFITGERGPYTGLPSDINALLTELAAIRRPVEDGLVERAMTCLALELPAAVYEDAIEKLLRPAFRRLTQELAEATAEIERLRDDVREQL